MRIAAINSSHRGDRGFTRFFVDKMFEGASQAGADCQVLTLVKLKINRCLSCYRCQRGERHLVCVYNDKDDVRMIFDQMSADVCAAYEQAGRELATLGRIRPSTQRKANQEVVPLPFFSVLKHLRPIRKRVIAYLRDQPA